MNPNLVLYWEPSNMSHTLKLSLNNLNVKYSGRGKQALDSGIAMCSKSMNELTAKHRIQLYGSNTILFYFEVLVEKDSRSENTECGVSIGVVHRQSDYRGKNRYSMYTGYNGYYFCNSSSVENYSSDSDSDDTDSDSEFYGTSIRDGDTFGCGLVQKNVQSLYYEIFFTRNGDLLKTSKREGCPPRCHMPCNGLFENHGDGKWYAMIRMHSTQYEVKTNFGTSNVDFKFDLQNLYKLQVNQLEEEYDQVELSPNAIDRTIEQYLKCMGYAKTLDLYQRANGKRNIHQTTQDRIQLKAKMRTSITNGNFESALMYLHEMGSIERFNHQEDMLIAETKLYCCWGADLSKNDDVQKIADFIQRWLAPHYQYAKKSEIATNMLSCLMSSLLKPDPNNLYTFTRRCQNLAYREETIQDICLAIDQTSLDTISRLQGLAVCDDICIKRLMNNPTDSTASIETK